jgi:hypothetical protein
MAGSGGSIVVTGAKSGGGCGQRYCTRTHLNILPRCRGEVEVFIQLHSPIFPRASSVLCCAGPCTTEDAQLWDCAKRMRIERWSSCKTSVKYDPGTYWTKWKEATRRSRG